MKNNIYRRTVVAPSAIKVQLQRWESQTWESRLPDDEIAASYGMETMAVVGVSEADVGQQNHPNFTDHSIACDRSYVSFIDLDH